MPAEGELVVRRVVQAVAGVRGRRRSKETRSRAYVNGRLCTAAQLAELAADLCDIASQHESVSLTDPSTHVEYLDAFGKLEAERRALAEQVEALAEVVRELEAASALERGRAEREDFLRWQMRGDRRARRHARARRSSSSTSGPPPPRRAPRRRPRGARPSGSTRERARSATSSRASAPRSIRRRPSTARCCRTRAPSSPRVPS